MHPRRSLVALLAAALLVAPLSACASGLNGLESMASPDQSARGVDGVLVSPDSAEMVDQTTEAQQVGQQVIHSGDATIFVGDPAAAADDVRDLAENLGGYVDSQTVSEASEDSRARATLAIRVPADEFDAAFEALHEVGEVVNQSRSALDVTLQYVDLEARVEALQGSVDRLTELMSGAASTGELIEAETALSQRQQELDSLRAQLKSLESQVSYSSIWVSLETESVLPGGPANFWEGLIAGLDSILKAAAAALVFFGVLLPWTVLIAVVVVLVLWLVRLGRKRHTSHPGHGEQAQRVEATGSAEPVE
ncbi:DUF4349 domain-containing protein [Leucobacter sp. W1153]|uniref:DUF4349 domain-containing protein n=1 Tax=Leucobacter sp. W1153 TaxID=3439064 RepID=UPI003F3FF0AB